MTILSRKSRVLLVEPLTPWAERQLENYAEVHYVSGVDETTLAREAADVDALILRAKGRITRAIFEAAPRLRVIGRHGVGVEHIDLEAAADHGVVVVNTPEANHVAVAEFTIGVLLGLARRVAEGERVVREERPWSEADRLLGMELRSQTLGVVGMGRIGRAVALICGVGFGMRVLYYDYKGRSWTDCPPGCESQPMDLDSLLAASDCVTLHVPLVAGTHHLLDHRRIALMKPTALLVNTARGALIDEETLLSALKGGRLRGAALDVMEVEPLKGSELKRMANVILTPHMASYTHEAFRRMGEVVFDVLRVLNGQAPKWRVI